MFATFPVLLIELKLFAGKATVKQLSGAGDNCKDTRVINVRNSFVFGNGFILKIKKAKNFVVRILCISNKSLILFKLITSSLEPYLNSKKTVLSLPEFCRMKNFNRKRSERKEMLKLVRLEAFSFIFKVLQKDSKCDAEVMKPNTFD